MIGRHFFKAKVKFYLSLFTIGSSLKKKEIDHSPARPTIVNIILLIIDACPPNKEPTRSRPKSPIEPQFKAPIITRIKANAFIVRMLLSVWGAAPSSKFNLTARYILLVFS